MEVAAVAETFGCLPGEILRLPHEERTVTMAIGLNWQNRKANARKGRANSQPPG